MCHTSLFLYFSVFISVSASTCLCLSISPSPSLSHTGSGESLVDCELLRIPITVTLFSWTPSDSSPNIYLNLLQHSAHLSLWLKLGRATETFVDLLSLGNGGLFSISLLCFHSETMKNEGVISEFATRLRYCSVLWSLVASICSVKMYYSKGVVATNS